MENKDLGSKKMNNEQQINEGFSGENIPKDYNPSSAELKTEVEKDENGNKKVVKRARNVDRDLEDSDTTASTEQKNEKTVENKDRNSDTAANRYPNSHPDNHTNRGNIELDKE